MAQHDHPGSKRAYATAPKNGPRLHPTPRPKRPAAVNEALLERAVAKVEALSVSLDRIVEDTATKEEVRECYTAINNVRRLIETKITTDREDRTALNLRLDALMTMMGDFIGRAPGSDPYANGEARTDPPPAFGDADEHQPEESAPPSTQRKPS